MKQTEPSPQTLLDALGKLAPDSSRTTLRSWIKDGRVTIDGKLAKRADQEVVAGQVIEVAAKQRTLPAGIKILYNDSHIVVVEKPIGVLSVATNFEKGETVHAILKERFRPRMVHVVHRLDQDTSGVMLFALNEKAKNRLKEMFEKHELERAYVAIVEGSFSEEKGVWQSYLYEDANYIVRPTQDKERGRLAITHFQVIGAKKEFTRLKLTLETGRKNQIRVHCQQAGHPVAGDKKYGSKTNPLKRLGLHAYFLGFKHPISNKPMIFTSPVPEQFDRLVKEKK